jgi:hypothetical protein
LFNPLKNEKERARKYSRRIDGNDSREEEQDNLL